MHYAEFEPLHTPRLTLRKVVWEDVRAYFRLFGSPEVAKYMLWEPHREIAQSEAAVRKVLSRYEAGRYYRWAITEADGNEMIGIVELLRFDAESGSCSFAYMLGETFWGKGYGTEAVCAVFAFAFEKMQVSSIIADHFPENPASGAVMRKAGMTYAGTIPEKYEKHGILYDAVEYRITAEQWKKKTRC